MGYSVGRVWSCCDAKASGIRCGLLRIRGERYTIRPDGRCRDSVVSYDAIVDSERRESEEREASPSPMLLSRRDMDIARGTTSVGPHRDDIGIDDQRPAAREYASQGQQRTAAIALKLSEIDIMRESAREEPVVLLDDMLAELDEAGAPRCFETDSGPLPDDADDGASRGSDAASARRPRASSFKRGGDQDNERRSFRDAAD